MTPTVQYHTIVSSGQAHADRIFLWKVAVGTPVTRRPPHRSRRAALPHRAPASGRDAQALRRIRMEDMGWGQPSLCESVHALPWHAVARTASAQRLTPIAQDSVVEYPAQTAIARPTIGPLVPQEHALQPGARRRDGQVQAPPQRLCDG